MPGSKELKKEKFLCREAILPPVIRVILPRSVSERYSRMSSIRYSFSAHGLIRIFRDGIPRRGYAQEYQAPGRLGVSFASLRRSIGRECPGVRS